MNSVFRQLLVCTLAGAAYVTPCIAQEIVPRDTVIRDTQRRTSPLSEAVTLSVIAGRGKSSPTVFVQGERIIHKASKRPTVYELELSKTLLRSTGESVYFEYFFAVQPAVAIDGNLRYSINRPLCSYSGCPGVVITEQRYASYGFGLTPFGARIMAPLPGNVRAGMELSAGAIYSSKAVPSNEAAHFNFHLVIRPTLGVPLGKGGTLWTAYEFAHISNANTGKSNPGINAGLFMLGFQPGRLNR